MVRKDRCNLLVCPAAEHRSGLPAAPQPRPLPKGLSFNPRHGASLRSHYTLVQRAASLRTPRALFPVLLSLNSTYSPWLCQLKFFKWYSLNIVSQRINDSLNS